MHSCCPIRLRAGPQKKLSKCLAASQNNVWRKPCIHPVVKPTCDALIIQFCKISIWDAAIDIPNESAVIAESRLLVLHAQIKLSVVQITALKCNVKSNWS